MVFAWVLAESGKTHEARQSRKGVRIVLAVAPSQGCKREGFCAKDNEDMSFERKGTPEPIQPAGFVLDDAVGLVCECGQVLGQLSHGVIRQADGVEILTIKPIPCPKCGKTVTPKVIGEDK